MKNVVRKIMSIFMLVAILTGSLYTNIDVLAQETGDEAENINQEETDIFDDAEGDMWDDTWDETEDDTSPEVPRQPIERTRSEAIKWVKSKVGKCVGWGQCVDLIEAYYDYFGIEPSGGDGKDYAHNQLPTGWKRVKKGVPQMGDILVYTNGEYGHVAIYESEKSSYHQNFNNILKVKRVTVNYKELKGYWGVIRPKFKDGDKIVNQSASSKGSSPKISKKKITIKRGKSYRLKMKNTKKKVKWSSSRKSVATVSQKGKIKAKKKGTAVITAKIGKRKYKCKVTVK